MYTYKYLSSSTCNFEKKKNITHGVTYNYLPLLPTCGVFKIRESLLKGRELGFFYTNKRQEPRLPRVERILILNKIEI